MNKSTTNLPGIPVLPGRNTPLIKQGPPANVRKPDAAPAPAPAEKPAPMQGK